MQSSYWMVYDITASFASVFLLGIGYSNSAIGIIIAVGSIVSVFLQIGVANLSDRNSNVTNIRISGIGTGLILAMMIVVFFLCTRCLLMTVLFCLMIAVHTTLHPFVNAICFDLEKSGESVYFGLARAMGSILAALIMLIGGIAVDTVGVRSVPALGIINTALLAVSVILVSKHYRKYCLGSTLPEYKRDTHKENSITLLDFVKRNRVFVAMSFGVVALFFGNAVFECFAIQIIRNVGGSTSQMGLVVCIMALLETPCMLTFRKIKSRFSYTVILRTAAFFMMVKIVMVFLAQDITFIYVAQIAQIFGYGLIFPGMVSFIDDIMNEAEAVRGQMVFTTSITVGNILGTVIGGIIMDVASVKTLLLICSILALIGTALIWTLIKQINITKSTH